MTANPQPKVMSIEAFEQFIDLPENAGRRFEYIGGEIIEVVSNNYSSEIGAYLCGVLILFVRMWGLGRVTGADGGYIIAGGRHIPDVAFISKQRQPEPCYEAYNPQHPDFAIEVLSPRDREHPREMRMKVSDYIRAGTLLWVVDDAERTVEVYEPGKPVRVLGIDNQLDGGSVLPGFTLKVSDIFAEIK